MNFWWWQYDHILKGVVQKLGEDGISNWMGGAEARAVYCLDTRRSVVTLDNCVISYPDGRSTRFEAQVPGC